MFELGFEASDVFDFGAIDGVPFGFVAEGVLILLQLFIESAVELIVLIVLPAIRSFQFFDFLYQLCDSGLIERNSVFSCRSRVSFVFELPFSR